MLGLAVLAAASTASASPGDEDSSTVGQQSQADLERRVQQLETEIRQLLDERNGIQPKAPEQTEPGAKETLNDDVIAGSGRSQAFTDSKFLKSVPLFGSHWRFSFGGYAKVDLIYDFSGTGDKRQFTISTIPVNGDPPPGSYFNLQAAETRFNFDVRNTAPGATKTRFFLEMDFYGSDPLSPRLRHAYFEYGNLLAGRTWTTLTELRQLPFLLDFAYGDSLYGGRTEQIRWQASINDELDWAIGLEKFDDSSIYDAGSATGTARSDLPKLVARITKQLPRSVVTVGGFLSQNRWDGTGSTPDATDLGWGATIGGRVSLGEGQKHFLGFGGSYSVGGTSDVISLYEAGVPNAVLGPNGELEGIPAWSAQVSLQVHWSDRFSSNFSFAYAALDPVSGLPAELMQTGHSGHVNVIYKVSKQLTVGLEYMHGRQELVNGDSGSADRIQSSVIFYF